MIRVRPTVFADLDGFEIRSEELALMTDIADHAVLAVNDSDQSATLLDTDGIILAIVGVKVHRPGCGSAWALLSPEIDHHPVEMTRAIRRLSRKCMEENNLRRLDILVNSESIKNIRWALILGFEQEGILRYFGDKGENLLIMARYRNV